MHDRWHGSDRALDVCWRAPGATLSTPCELQVRAPKHGAAAAGHELWGGVPIDRVDFARADRERSGD